MVHEFLIDCLRPDAKGLETEPIHPRLVHPMRLPTCPQSQVRQGVCESRGCVSCGEVPVRLSQGASSRHRQERRAGVLAVGTRQSVPRPQNACVRVTKTGQIRLTRQGQAANSAEDRRSEAYHGRTPALIRASLRRGPRLCRGLRSHELNGDRNCARAVLAVLGPSAPITLRGR